MQNQNTATVKKERPPGVVILAIYYFVISLIMLCLLPHLISAPPPANPEWAGAVSNLMFFLWCEAICGMIAAFGLWFLAEWARVLAIVGAALVVIVLLWPNAVQGANSNVIFGVGCCVYLSVGVIVYLMLPGVRKAFAA